MTRSKRMQSIINLAQHVEKDAALALADSVEKIKECENRLQELREAREEYIRDFQSPGAKMSAAQLIELRRFTSNLDDAISMLERQLHDQQQLNDHQRGVWHSSHNKVNALEGIQTRHKQEETRIHTNRQQMEVDDRSQHLRTKA